MSKPLCPHCNHPLSPDWIRSEAASLQNARRKIRAGGRPRSDAPRCPCGKMTARLAKIRKHEC